jgi:VanZ family protein
MPVRSIESILVHVAFWGCALVVLFLALAPVRIPMPSTGWDKSNHLLAFGTLAVLGLWSYPRRPMVLLLSLLAYGALIEGLQSFTLDRFSEWADLFADGIGLVLGYLAVQGVARHVGPKRAPKRSLRR